MWLEVNGERIQNGSTKTMIFNVPKIVSYVSHFMILEPGDVITTGTPPGVGMGMKPPRFLKAGDVVTLGIEGLGEQRQSLAYKDAEQYEPSGVTNANALPASARVLNRRARGTLAEVVEARDQ